MGRARPGFRGDVVDDFLPPATIELMRRVKTAFDPNDLLNPGKLYRPLGIDQPILALDEAPLRAHRDRVVPVTVRNHLADAFACNGNGLCHHHDRAEVMCPSYKATGDPALSPRGRADLLRAWAASAAEADPASAELADAVAHNLHQCLSCAACTGHCPVEVDIPELKSRFLEEYYATRRRPPSHALLARFETMAGLTGRLPGPLNELGARLSGKALGLVDLPAPPPSPRRARRLPRWNPGERPTTIGSVADPDRVVILPDVFTSRLEPATLVAAVDLLTRLGYDTSVAPFVPSGKFDHVKGRRAAFRRSAASQAELVRSVVADGAIPVVIEPAVALLYRHEYPLAVAEFPTAVKNLVELLDDRAHRLPKVTGAVPRPVALLGHCTERVMAPGWLEAWGRVLLAAGHTVTIPPVGCCGMAGIFGHEAKNQQLSADLFDLSWRSPVEAAAEARSSAAVATGYSCRSQAKRFAPASPVIHPVTLLV